MTTIGTQEKQSQSANPENTEEKEPRHLETAECYHIIVRDPKRRTDHGNLHWHSPISLSLSELTLRHIVDIMD